MQLIDNTANLEKLCVELNKAPFVCIDLEFLREHTYFAQLCLIQIASLDKAAIIDPLAKDINLQAFFELMQNPSVVKVFHSGRQDIELLYQLSHHIPLPLFDTQIAASALGYGESVSYEHMVKSFLNISLDKTSRLSDWSKRPLSEKQLEYAACDVTHLAKIYPLMITQLQSLNRIDWIKDELDNLGSPFLYDNKPEDAWIKIRHRSHNPQFLTLLRELACWREKRAMMKNTPRQSLIKDDILLNICASSPETKEDLLAVRGMRADIAKGKIGNEIIEVVKKSKSLPQDKLVSVCDNDEKDYQVDGVLLEIMRMVLRISAAQNNIVPKLLSSDDELKAFCSNHDTQVRFMHGWRYSVFGCLIDKICSGKTAITYNNKTRSIELLDI